MKLCNSDIKIPCNPFNKSQQHNTLTTILKMSRLTQLASLFSLASVGFAQIPNTIPFQVTGSLDR